MSGFHFLIDSSRENDDLVDSIDLKKVKRCGNFLDGCGVSIYTLLLAFFKCSFMILGIHSRVLCRTKGKVM